MIWRWRTVSAAKGSWAEGLVARVGSKWQARYRSEHSAWRNAAIRHIPVQGKVSGFFGHVDGDDEGLKGDVREKSEQDEVLLYKKRGRNRKDVLLADGSLNVD